MLHCEVCKAPLLDEDNNGHFVRIQRGYFSVDLEGNIEEDPRIKFEMLVCSKCYLEDQDLCRFFNKLNLRLR